uniref:Uncharacterized protein n=1 Tax=Vespula pensylvanica TaxID=30213 RepID=A0A834PAG5_VESPE|nr:hypothetical protein H0235_002619 [Vespula pensylvanica]
MLLAGVARRLLWRVHGDEGGISKRAFDGRGNGNDDTFLRFANSYNFVCSLRLDEVETSMTSRWKRSQSENKSSLSQEILRKLRPSLAPNNEDDVVVAPAGLLIAAPTRGSEITTYECTTRYYRVRHIPRDLEIRVGASGRGPRLQLTPLCCETQATTRADFSTYTGMPRFSQITLAPQVKPLRELWPVCGPVLRSRHILAAESQQMRSGKHYNYHRKQYSTVESRENAYHRCKFYGGGGGVGGIGGSGSDSSGGVGGGGDGGGGSSSNVGDVDRGEF